MERNEESLSTRDLAASSDSAAGATTTSEPETQTGDSFGDAPAQASDQERTSRVDSSLDTQAADRQPDTESDMAGGEAGTMSASPSSAGAASATEGDATSPSTTAGARRGETVAAPASAPSAADSATGANEPLLPAELTETFQRRWEEVQTRFVDEPRGAVEDADGLVAKLMQQLAEGFAQERERLEAQWGRGEDISTEDLRVALQRYRSFFQRLLST
jgi:hypothetical protein